MYGLFLRLVTLAITRSLNPSIGFVCERYFWPQSALYLQDEI